jgi:hypothetical protein
VRSNSVRKNYVADQFIARNPEIVGVYRLTMKSNSDNDSHNFRASTSTCISRQQPTRSVVQRYWFSPSGRASKGRGLPPGFLLRLERCGSGAFYKTGVRVDRGPGVGVYTRYAEGRIRPRGTQCICRP